MKCPYCKKEIETEYQEIKYKDKTYRIYKWENKSLKDFPMPKGFNWCPYMDFVELINKRIIELENYPVDYVTEQQFEINKKDFPLSRFYLNRDSLLYSNNWDLDGSSDNGRVVLKKK